MPEIAVRDAGTGDLTAIAAITVATGQEDDWGGGNPAYVEHLMRHGRVVVAVEAGQLTGFGAVQQIGTGPAAVSMVLASSASSFLASPKSVTCGAPS